MTTSTKTMSGWGALNVALNGLVAGAVIRGYRTARPANPGDAVGIDVIVAPGADQASVHASVRSVLPPEFSSAAVRTKTE